MPATPLPDRHVEEVEEVEDAGLALIAAHIRFLEAISAAKVSGLKIAMAAKKIRQLASTYDETPHVKRTAKEQDEDRRRLRRWTPTGYYFESLEGGKVEDPEAA